MKSKRYLLVLLLVCLVPVFPVLAVDNMPDEAAIAEMIRELGDRRYAVRQAAVQKLREAGIWAVPALEVAAQSDDPEVAVSARELLPILRLGLGLGSSWPSDLAEQVRRIETLSQREKTALLRQVMTRIADPDTVAQFVLARLAAGGPDEAAAIVSSALSHGNVGLAQRLTEVLKPPMNDGQAVLLAWSWMVKGRAKEALTVLAQCGSEVHGVNNMRAQIIGKGVASIGDSAFSSCTNFNSITIPDGVARIGDRAFKNCTSLSSITIGNGVTNIGDYAFYNCTGLGSISVATENPSYRSIDGVLFDKEKTTLIQYPAGKTNISYSIPDSVTSIGGYAFWNCTSLSSITIPDSVTSIGNAAFQHCSGLSSITIGNGVTNIGNRAFNNCTNLNSITIPDGVTRIGNRAFQHCTSLGSITIGDGVTSIGDYAFYHCTGLSSITIPASVTRIGNRAFQQCASLTSIKFKGNVPISYEGNAFLDSTPTIYRLSTATGWGDTFAGRPVELWND